MDRYFSFWNILFLILAFIFIISWNNILLFLSIIYVLLVFYFYAFLEHDNSSIFSFISEDNHGWRIIFWSVFIILLFWISGIVFIGSIFFLGTLIKFLNSK